MKHLFILVICLVTTNVAAQKFNDLELDSNFAAIVVKNMDTSLQWYLDVLKYKVVKQTEMEDRGLKQANLIHGDHKLELIEITSSIDPFENSSIKKGLVQGIFKFGFSVSNFKAWKNHLLELNLINDNDVVMDPITSKRMLIVKDPDGNRIQLFEN